MIAKTHIKKIIISFVLLLTYCSVYAQQNDTLSIRKNDKGKIEFAKFSLNGNSERKMSNDTLFLKSILASKEGDEFHLIRETTDKLGITTKRFQQYYKGIRVDNAQYLLHSRIGYIEVMTAAVVPMIMEQLNMEFAPARIQFYTYCDIDTNIFL